MGRHTSEHHDRGGGGEQHGNFTSMQSLTELACKILVVACLRHASMHTVHGTHVGRRGAETAQDDLSHRDKEDKECNDDDSDGNIGAAPRRILPVKVFDGWMT